MDGISAKRTTELMYMMIKTTQENGNQIPLSTTCVALEVSRSGYIDWLKRLEIPHPEDSYEIKLRDHIQKIAVDFPRYGYRRMTMELQRQGYAVNHKRVLRLMREDNLLCVKQLFKPTTTDSNHGFRIYPNLAADTEVTALNQLWVADITYIRLLTEFIYLAVIVDVFSRKCIGWGLDRNIDTHLATCALDMALTSRRDLGFSNLIHHSDQGVQYASQEYVEKLKKDGIKISMSRKGNPYDNAFAETFIKTLKYEEVYLSEYESFTEAFHNIKKFIEEVYNKKRLHSSIGYLPPNEFEKGVVLKNIVS